MSQSNMGFGMESFDAYSVLSEFGKPSEREESPSIEKFMADMVRASAAEQPAEEEIDEAFLAWLEGQPESVKTTAPKEQKSVYKMDAELKELEDGFADMDDDDRGRMYHGFRWNWHALVAKHPSYIERINAIRAKLDPVYAD